MSIAVTSKITSLSYVFVVRRTSLRALMSMSHFWRLRVKWQIRTERSGHFTMKAMSVYSINQISMPSLCMKYSSEQESLEHCRPAIRAHHLWPYLCFGFIHSPVCQACASGLPYTQRFSTGILPRREEASVDPRHRSDLVESQYPSLSRQGDGASPVSSSLTKHPPPCCQSDDLRAFGREDSPLEDQVSPER